MALSPKQLKRDNARPGQALTFDGQRWTAGEDLAALRELVMLQGDVIRELVIMLQNEHLRLPPLLEEYLGAI